MEATAAVPARGWLAPLADLALLAAIGAAAPLAFWTGVAVTRASDDLNLGLVAGTGVGAATIGAAIVARVRRKALRVMTLGVAVATGLTLAVGGWAGFWAVACGPRLTQPWAPYAGMGIAYFGLGLWSLRRRFLWGLPLAVLLAFVVFLSLLAALPGTSRDCEFGTLGDVHVLPVHGDGRWVTNGSTSTKLASSQGIVLREHT